MGQGGERSLSGPDFAAVAHDVLRKGASFRFKATGLSMFPLIRDGDVVTVSPLNGNPLRLGDVVAFTPSELQKLVVHRVIKIMGDSFLIKGDNIYAADGLFPKANILGRVTRVERGKKAVFSGIGPERALIVFLSRRGVVLTLLLPIWRIVRPVMKRWIV